MKRRDVPHVIREIQGRDPQALDTFIVDCGLSASDRNRRIADAVRKSLTVAAAFRGDRLRADDRLPGTLEVLPGWDSVDFVEWIMTFEEMLGVRVPVRIFDGMAGVFTVADLVKAASISQDLLPEPGGKHE